MRTFYPEIEPYKEGMLPLDDTHIMSIREYGNPEGIPVIVVHGGPGAGCSPDYARYFDPDKYRVVLYDQRGCGQSLPWASLENNTTLHLIDDLEKLRQHLVGDDKVLLFGGSWGSTLPMLYAEQYPRQVEGLILRGIFLGRTEDLTAFVNEDCQAVKNNPQGWREFKAHAFPDDPDKWRDGQEIITAYYDLVSNEDERVWKPAAAAFAKWEAMNSYLDMDSPEAQEELEWSQSKDGMCMGRIESHYMKYGCFMESGQIETNIDELAEIPIYIVQGNDDNVCPRDQAEAFIATIKATGNRHVFEQFTDAGHSGCDPDNINHLVRATDDFTVKYQAGYFAQEETRLTDVTGTVLGGGPAAAEDKDDLSEGEEPTLPLA